MKTENGGTRVAPPSLVLKSVGPKLVPFFKAVTVYFMLFIPADEPSWLAMLVKALPVLGLVVFVLLHGMSLADEYAFSRRVLLGLSLSAVADCLLAWPGPLHFLLGMAVFGAAQVLYIAALGFHPLRPALGACLYVAAAAALSKLVPRLHGALLLGVPLYTALLTTMTWRAMARVQLFEELWTWTKLCACAGGVLFTISDAIIGFHMFHAPVPHSQVLVMVTYYAAQLCLALSVVDSRASFKQERPSDAAPCEASRGCT